MGSAGVIWWPLLDFSVHPPTAARQRIGPVVLHTLWNHRENLWESFVMPLFVRSTVCSSVLVLKMRCSVATPKGTPAHKSSHPWLCSRNPSPPARSEAELWCWENQVMWAIPVRNGVVKNSFSIITVVQKICLLLLVNFNTTPLVVLGPYRITWVLVRWKTKN